MPAERTIYIHDRRKTPLAMRARFAWTFFGVGLFAATNLFLIGSFLLMEAIRKPLVASTTTIVAAGFMLALAAFLLAYLIWPRVKASFGAQPDFERRSVFSSPVLTVPGEALQTQIEAEQALTLRKQFSPRPDAALLRHAHARKDSDPRAEYGDAARARQ